MVAEAGGDKRDGGIAKQNNSVAIAFDPIDKYNLRQIHFDMWYCEAKRQNNSVATAFDPIDKYILQFETNTL